MSLVFTRERADLLAKSKTHSKLRKGKGYGNRDATLRARAIALKRAGANSIYPADMPLTAQEGWSKVPPWVLPENYMMGGEGGDMSKAAGQAAVRERALALLHRADKKIPRTARTGWKETVDSDNTDWTGISSTASPQYYGQPKWQ